jgi:hypothetical protein
VARSNHNKTEKRSEKIIHGSDIISALMSPPEKKGLYVVMPVKLLTPQLSPSSSTDLSWGKRFHLSPRRCRRGEDKSSTPRNLA